MPGRFQKSHGYRSGRGVKSPNSAKRKTVSKAKGNNIGPKPNVKRYKIK